MSTSSTEMHILQISIDLEFYASNTIPTRWEQGKHLTGTFKKQKKK